MNSPFHKAFNSKSPLKEHKKIRRQINAARRKFNKDPNNKYASGDFEEIHADLYAKETAAKKAHDTNRTEEEDVQVREDEDAAQGSAVEMQSPLHGYVDASDMVDSNPPTAHMWNKVFDSMTTAGLGIVDARAKDQKKKKQKGDLARIGQKDKEGNVYTKEQYAIDYPDASVKCPGTQTYNSATGKCE